jgi:hypothetical protein
VTALSSMNTLSLLCEPEGWSRSKSLLGCLGLKNVSGQGLCACCTQVGSIPTLWQFVFSFLVANINSQWRRLREEDPFP